MNSPMASARRVKPEQLMYVLIWLTIFNYAIELQYTTHLKFYFMNKYFWEWH